MVPVPHVRQHFQCILIIPCTKTVNCLQLQDGRTSVRRFLLPAVGNDTTTNNGDFNSGNNNSNNNNLILIL